MPDGHAVNISSSISRRLSSRFLEYSLQVSVVMSDTADNVEGPSDKPQKKERKNKKGNFRHRLLKKRQDNGIWLLSEKEEAKIYRMKKGMRNKGASAEEIKEEIRLFRKKAELNMKKTDKKCFKCRKLGHSAASCPTIQNPNGRSLVSSAANDICYKCGSSEHRLFQCKLTSNELPFASCYICNEAGHISRDCSKNTRGIYPKGGCCKKCSSVNHLIKDCPELEEEKGELVLQAASLRRLINPCLFYNI